MQPCADAISKRELLRKLHLRDWDTGGDQAESGFELVNSVSSTLLSKHQGYSFQNCKEKGGVDRIVLYFVLRTWPVDGNWSTLPVDISAFSVMITLE